MPIVPLPLANGWYIDDSAEVSAQECLNVYPVYNEPGASNPTALRSPFGLTEFSSDNADGPCRALISAQADDGQVRLFTINGSNFYELDTAGNRTLLNGSDPIAAGARVQWAFNGLVIALLVPGTPVGYFFTLNGDVFETITDTAYIDYGDKYDVTYKDGFFVYITLFEFFLSSIRTDNDGKNFDGLDFATAEINPDRNVSCQTIRNELYIFGTESIEVFQNVGALDFPFARVNGAHVDRGLSIPFPDLCIPFQDSYVFVGAGRNEGVAIWRGVSASSQRLSTPAIENLLQETLKTGPAGEPYLFRYSEQGHYFFGLNFYNQFTILYDETASQLAQKPIWHRRESNSLSYWRASHIEEAGNRIFACDTVDARIGELELTVGTEYTETLTRRFNTSYTQAEGERWRCPWVELHTENDVAPPNAVLPEPGNVTLRFSDDGGYSFIGEQSKPMPQNQASIQRTRFQRLGQADFSRVWQFETAINQPITFLKCTQRIEVN